MDVTNGALTYTGSTLAPGNTLTVLSTGGSYLFAESAESISLTSGAIAAGWRNISAISVKGPEAKITSSITINADSAGGDVTALGAFENTLPASLTITGAPAITLQSVASVGAQSYTATGSTTLNGTLSTAGGAVSFSGPLALGGPASIDTTQGGGTPAGASITFNKAANGVHTFSITAGSSGAVAFRDVAGSKISPLASLVVSGGSILLHGVTTTGAQSYAATTSTTLNTNLTTAAGSVSFSGPVLLNGGVMVDTTNSALTPAGASVTFSGTVDGAQALTVLAGTTGAMTFQGVVGGITPLASLTTSGKANSLAAVTTTGLQSYTGTSPTTLGGNLTTSGGAVSVAGFAVLGTPVTIDTTHAGASPTGANVSFNSTVNGADLLSVTAGTGGAVTFAGSIGGSSPLISLTVGGNAISVAAVKTIGVQSFTAAGSTTLNGALTTSAGTVSVSGPALLGGVTAIDTTNGGIWPAGANVTFSSTVNGALGLSVIGGSTGAVTFQGAMGGSTPLFSLTVSGKTIAAAGVATSGVQSYTATNVTLSGNLNTSGGQVTVTGTTILGGSVVIDTTNGGHSPFGANIAFSDIINATTAGGQALTLMAGSGGQVTLPGAVGGGKALGRFAVAAGGLTTLGGSITTSRAGGGVGNIDLSQANGTITLGTNITIASNNGAVNLSGSTVNGNTVGGQRLIVTAGSGAVTLGSEGLGKALSSLTVTTSGPTVLAGGTIDTTTAGGGSGAVNLLGATGGITLLVSVAINTHGGSVNLLGSGVNGATVGGQSLTVTAGAGAVRLGTAGLTKALASITESGSSVAEADVVTTGPESYTGTGTVNINGNITTSGAAVTVTGPANLLVPLQPPPTVIDTTAGGTVPAGASVSFSSTLDGAEPFVIIAGTGGAVSLGGTVGGLTPLTSLAVTGGSAVLQAVHVAGSGSIAVTANTISINGSLDPAVGGATVTLDSTGGAVTENSGGSINAGNLLLLGSGPFALNQPGNHVSTLAGNVGGNVQYTDAGAVTVGTVNGTSGLTVGSSLTLATGGALTIGDGSATTQSLSANSFTLTPGVNNSFLLAPPPPQNGVVSLNSNGILSGSGTVSGNLTNGGVVSPGGTGAAGTVMVTGNYLETPAGALNVELGAVGAGNSDLLVINGQASLGGALNVSRLPGFSDVLGNGYQVLQFASQTMAPDNTGIDFAARNGLMLPSGHILNPVYSSSPMPNLTLVDSAAGVNVTKSVSLKFSGFRFTAPATYKQQITITNTSGSTLTGPIELLLAGLSSGITLANRTGIGIASDAGDPYITVQVGSLAPGQSISVVLSFYDPGLLAITYTPLVFAGGVP